MLHVCFTLVVLCVTLVLLCNYLLRYWCYVLLVVFCITLIDFVYYVSDVTCMFYFSGVIYHYYPASDRFAATVA